MVFQPGGDGLSLFRVAHCTFVVSRKSVANIKGTMASNACTRTVLNH